MMTATVTESEKEIRPVSGWRVVAAKELADHLLSGRFIVLMAVLGIATAAAVFAASGGIRDVAPSAQGITALFLKLFTVTADPVPFPLIVFVGFLAPLLGIMFGFDAVNGERSQGTLPRLLSQPIHRDEVILGKFVAGLSVVAIMLASLVLFVSGIGIFRLGVVPSAAEVTRLFVWLLLAVVYVGFWQALATLTSVLTRRASTSALIPVGVWLVLALFGSFIFSAVAGIISPRDGTAAAEVAYLRTQQTVSQISPITLFQQGSTVLLDPEVRTVGLVTLEQVDRAIVSELNLAQSLGVIWPQLVVLVAMTAVMYALAYIAFMRQEVPPSDDDVPRRRSGGDVPSLGACSAAPRWARCAADPDRASGVAATPAGRAATVWDLRRMGRRRTPRAVFDYVDGAAEAEISLHRSREAFRHIEFVPASSETCRRSTPRPQSSASPLRCPSPCRPPASPG